MTRLPEDRGRFKTPSLRNVALTGPYMHDGSIDTLEKVVEFYDRGGGPNPNLDSAIRPLRLTSTERSELVVFLRALQSYGIIDLAERPRDVAQYARAPLTGPRHTQHAVPKAAGPALGAARR
jgi:cytochrome c peroxidase